MMTIERMIYLFTIFIQINGVYYQVKAKYHFHVLVPKEFPLIINYTSLEDTRRKVGTFIRICFTTILY